MKETLQQIRMGDEAVMANTINMSYTGVAKNPLGVKYYVENGIRTKK